MISNNELEELCEECEKKKMQLRGVVTTTGYSSLKEYYKDCFKLISELEQITNRGLEIATRDKNLDFLKTCKRCFMETIMFTIQTMESKYQFDSYMSCFDKKVIPF